LEYLADRWYSILSTAITESANLHDSPKSLLTQHGLIKVQKSLQLKTKYLSLQLTLIWPRSLSMFKLQLFKPAN